MLRPEQGKIHLRQKGERYRIALTCVRLHDRSMDRKTGRNSIEAREGNASYSALIRYLQFFRQLIDRRLLGCCASVFSRIIFVNRFRIRRFPTCAIWRGQNPQPMRHRACSCRSLQIAEYRTAITLNPGQPAYSREFGRSFHAIVGSDSTASWAPSP